MVAPLKRQGLEDVRSLRRRTRRLLGLERIFPGDAEYITTRLDEMEARIVAMHEIDDNGEEVE
jgi:hypothetical protein